MADDTDTTTAPAPGTMSPDLVAQLPALIQRLGLMPQPVQQDTTPVQRSWTSLLGQALAGGPPVAGMSDADKEIAGHQALGQFSTGLMAASRYQPGQTIFSNLAQGFQGAQRGEIGAEEMAMAKLGAQQEYAQQQGQNKLEALKAALPFLTLKTQMDQAAAARNLADGGGAPPAPNVAQGGSISGNTYEGAIAGHEGLTADKNLPTTVGGFIPSTWQAFATANPDLFKGMSPDQVAAARSDPKLNAAGITWLAQNNAPVLTKYGAPVTGQSLGIAHYLGAEPTAGIMAASDNTPVRNFVSDAAVKANPELATLTVGQLKQRYANVPAPGFLTATKTAATPPAANAAPPGVQMGGTPPAPPGGASGAAGVPYTGGGVGAVLAPGGAANPVVTKGTPIPGRVASDVGAIRGGMDLAQIKPDVTALTAGPGAPTATASAAPATPQPAWGSTVGSYSFGPTSAPAPPATVTPPAQPTPTTPPTTPPPQPNPDIKIGDLTIRHPGTFADYRASQYVPPTGEDFNPDLTPEQQSAFALRAQQLQLAQRQASTLLPADQPKALIDIKAKQADLAAEQQNAIAAKKLAAAANTTKYNETQQKDIQTRYDAATAAYNTAAGNEQTTQGKLREIAQQGKNAIDVENVKSGNQVSAKLQQDYNTDAMNSGKRIDDLELLRGLSDNAGTPTPLTSIKVGGRSLADIISATGFGGQNLQDKAAAVQAFHAGVLNVVRDLRSGGAATGEPRSNQDLQFVTDMAPNEWQDPNTRSSIISFLQQTNQRRIDMAAEISRLMATRLPNGQSVPAGQAVADARKNLPDFVPQIPANIMGADQQPERQHWFEQNNVKPYTFFRYPNGHVDMYKGPPPQGQQ